MDKKISIWFCLTVNFVCLLIVHDYLCYVYSEPGFNSKLFLQPVHCDKRGLAQSLAHYCSSRLNFTTTQVSVRFDPNSFVRITVLSFLRFFGHPWSQYNSTIICIFWSLGRFASIISSFHCSAVVPTSGQLSQQPALLIATCAGSQNINIFRLKRSWLSKLRSKFCKMSKMTFCMTQSVKVVVEEVRLWAKLRWSRKKQSELCGYHKEQKSECVLQQTNKKSELFSSPKEQHSLGSRRRASKDIERDWGREAGGEESPAEKGQDHPWFGDHPWQRQRQEGSSAHS